MFRKNHHPGDETPKNDDGKAGRDPDAFRKPQKKSRHKFPPLWQPKSEPRDVNLEMTADDLDRSAKSPPLLAHSARSTSRRPKLPDFPDVPGLDAEWRERFMPPPQH